MLINADFLLMRCTKPPEMRAYAITTAGSSAELDLSMGKYSKLCTRAPAAAENFLNLPMEGSLVKYIYKGRMADCACAHWPTGINRTGRLGRISALPSWYLWERKEEAVVVAISLLSLFVIRLLALICFTDVARAPPSTALVTERQVTAAQQSACVRSDSGASRENNTELTLVTVNILMIGIRASIVNSSARMRSKPSNCVSQKVAYLQKYPYALEFSIFCHLSTATSFISGILCCRPAKKQCIILNWKHKWFLNVCINKHLKCVA